ncbi:MAG TPA: glycine cleavage system aminomethyltransferase GcvT, partial [Chloroflexota bacterium]|nr:glycine cleavage system aminomethyltransferase GcvT [Chloroflexota bacterium]
MTTGEGMLKQTALHAEHIRLGARMVPFAGWDMPVQYQSILKEHRSVRVSVGMFDVSHMGEFWVRGAGAGDFLQRLTPNDVSTIAVGGSQYSCFLQPDGGIIDDIFIYRPIDDYLVVVNAANIQKVADWLSAQPRPGVEVVDVSEGTALVAVQGPDAVNAVQTLSTGDLLSLPRRGIRSQPIAGGECLVARTGYTGEDGLEIFCSPSDVRHLWQALLHVEFKTVEPCGLGARDTLRLEAGNLLYGHDMDERVNPLEAGLGFIVKLDKGDFIGRDALVRTRQNGSHQRLVGFEMVGRGIPRTDCDIVLADRLVGRVTSGSYGPTVDKNIGLGYVEPPLAGVGQT